MIIIIIFYITPEFLHYQYPRRNSGFYDENCARMDQGKAWPPNAPGARKLKMIFSSKLKIQILTSTPENNTHILGEQMHSSNEITQRCPQRHATPTSKYQFFEKHGKQYHEHGLRRWDCCQTSREGCRGCHSLKWKHPDKTKSPWGRFTILDLVTTEALALLGFSHAPVIAPLLNLCQVLVTECSNSRSVCRLTNNCQ